MGVRSGLVKARIRGFTEATADTVTVLDRLDSSLSVAVVAI